MSGTTRDKFKYAMVKRKIIYTSYSKHTAWITNIEEKLKVMVEDFRDNTRETFENITKRRRSDRSKQESETAGGKHIFGSQVIDVSSMITKLRKLSTLKRNCEIQISLRNIKPGKEDSTKRTNKIPSY